MVRLDGERLSRRSEEERARLRGRLLGVLYQQVNLVEHLSVEDNVALAQLLGSRAGDAGWRGEVLERCGIAGRAHDRPSRLSGGELARAGVAVALANDPPVVLADEPTGELDEDTAARVLDLLRERAAAGAAVVLVTHSPAVAASADRELRLRDGRVAT
jgi:putative ABC transport system ATP-binding protein